MAIVNGNSGTFNISTRNTAISGYVAWQETYDDSTYAQTNETTVTMDVYLHRTNIYSGETSIQGVGGERIAYFDSEEVKDTSNLYLTIAGNSSSSGGEYTKVYSASMPIEHNDDGSKSITLGYFMTNNYTGNASASNAFKVDKTTSTVTLKKIPRYGTASQSVKSSTETTITMNWSSDNIVDYIWYRYKKTSASTYSSWIGYDVVDAKSGQYVVGGLDSNTTYHLQVKIRRKDSQLTTESSVKEGKTYPYPRCTRGTSFIIGKELTLYFENPLNRRINVTIYGNGYNVGAWATNQEILTGFNSASAIDSWYNSIPEIDKANYDVVVTYDGHQERTNNVNQYIIDPNECEPIFTDFDYSTNLAELTGNNSTIINLKTTTTITIPVTKRAIGKNHAYIKSYKFECGNQPTRLHDYSEVEAVSTSIMYCNSPVIKAIAIDSRGVQKVVTKTVPNFKEYVPPSFPMLKVERNNGVDITSFLNLEIDYWTGNFGAGNNKITAIYYRSRKKGQSSWASFQEIPTSNLRYENNKIYLENYLVHANGSSGGFEVGVAYDFQVRIYDGLDTYLFSRQDSDIATLTDGRVGFSLLKDENGNYHIGLDGMPDLRRTLNISNKNPMVKMSVDQPNSEETLWIKKSNNLIETLDLRVGYLYDSVGSPANGYEGRCYNRAFVKLEPNTTYTFSLSTPIIGNVWLYSAPDFSTGVRKVGRYLETNCAFTTGTNDLYFSFWLEGEIEDAQDIMLQTGDGVTEYEPFVIPETYIRSANGVYEKLSYDIHEIGSNENGHWIKYKNGIMECWHTLIGETFACTERYGSAYFFRDVNHVENDKTWEFPQKFATTEGLNVQVTVASPGYTMPSMGDPSVSRVTGYCVMPYSVSSITFHWHFRAKGYWK